MGVEWEMEWEWNRNIHVHENWLSKWYDRLKIRKCRFLFCRIAVFFLLVMFCDSTAMGMEWEWNRNIHGNCLTHTVYDRMVCKIQNCRFLFCQIVGVLLDILWSFYVLWLCM